MIDIILRNHEKSFEEILTGIDKSSFIEKRDENNTWEIDFTISRTIRNYLTFDMLTFECSIFLNNQEFIVKKVTYSALGDKVTKSIIATHVYYTIQDGFQYNTITGTLSVNDCLSHIFSVGSRGFTYEVIDKNNILEKVEQENFGNSNYLQLINEVIEDYKLVVLPENKHLVFFPQEDYGVRIENPIRYNYNTDNLNLEIDTFSLRTQIKGFGKKKEDDSYYFSPITYTSSEAEKWGIRIQTPVEDDRYTSQGNMLRRLRLDLQDYPATTISTNLKLSYDVNLGDFVMLIYEPLAIEYDVKIVGFTKYWLCDKPPEITLSNNKMMTKNIIASLFKKINGGIK
ncbi:hypothetical protein EP04_01990 [Listeria monocytogenes]|nr:hypothetical protein [Listeria monocytogenes]